MERERDAAREHAAPRRLELVVEIEAREVRGRIHAAAGPRRAPSPSRRSRSGAPPPRRRRITSRSTSALAMRALAPREELGSRARPERVDRPPRGAAPAPVGSFAATPSGRRWNPASIRSNTLFASVDYATRARTAVSTKSRIGPHTFVRLGGDTGLSSGHFTRGIPWTRTKSSSLLQQGWLTTSRWPCSRYSFFTIALERAWRYRGLEKATRDLARKQVDALVRRDVATARASARPRTTPIARVFGEGLRWRNIALEDLNEVLNTGRQEALAELRAGSGSSARSAPSRPTSASSARWSASCARSTRSASPATRLRRRGLGHRRGADRDGGRPARRDPGAGALQLAADAASP